MQRIDFDQSIAVGSENEDDPPTSSSHEAQKMNKEERFAFGAVGESVTVRSFHFVSAPKRDKEERKKKKKTRKVVFTTQ